MAEPLEPTTIKEQPLPESVSYYEITDAPQTLQELNPQDGAALSTATATIGSLGDLAFKDLVNTLDLAAQAVTNAKIAVDAIQGAVIAAGAITETKVASDAISTPKLQAGAITTAKIAAGAVTATEIAAGAITAGKISAGAVVAGTIAAGAIDGVTITGSLIRTASSGVRVQMNNSTAALEIYDSTRLRAQMYQQGLTFWDSSGNNVADIYAGVAGGLLITTANSGSNSRSIYIQGGSSGVAAMGVGGSDFIWASGSLNDVRFSRDLQPAAGGLRLGGNSVYMGGVYTFKLYLDTVGYVFSGGSAGYTFPAGWSVSKIATGRYTVTHNLGTLIYSVVVTPVAGAAKVWSIESFGSNSFTVRIGNLAGSLEDNDFCFILNLA